MGGNSPSKKRWYGVGSGMSGQWTAGQRPRAATGRDGGDKDDTQDAARRNTNGPGLDSDAGQPRVTLY
ncbi:hypothetical protein J6590_009300 [Homalodisca vitripennis]|nr:hypothetical protein J6590_009300 [Homalodisca vitripennis]